jgi:hypothetical protein
VVKPSINRGTVWSDKEVKALIATWGESNVQEELDGAVRNQAIYQRISCTNKVLNVTGSSAALKLKI